MIKLPWGFVPSPLTLVKLAVVLLGVVNLTMTLERLLPSSRSARSKSATEPRQIRIKDYPELELLQLDVDLPTTTLFTEETVHYPVAGPLADLEWASLIPEGHPHGGLVFMGPDARPYSVTMFHALHCLDRIRKAIVGELPVEPPATAAVDDGHRHDVHSCFNYLRQMILCAANTRLNPINHAQPSSGRPAADGIGLTYTCRDWNRVYEAVEANHVSTMNRTMSFVPSYTR